MIMIRRQMRDEQTFLGAGFPLFEHFFTGVGFFWAFFVCVASTIYTHSARFFRITGDCDSFFSG